MDCFYKNFSFFIAISIIVKAQFINAITISNNDAEQIAAKIWHNESGGSIQGLTSWNPGENFPSLGIGHFIWYSSKNSNEPFQETFKELLKFISSHGETIPEWLANTPSSPWSSREEFYAEIDSPRMVALRTFLLQTKHLQAMFIIQRLDNALPQMLEGLTPEERIHVIVPFHKLADSPQGLFALIDYINFKGLGISPKEKYKGKAWGLRQVLLGMPLSTDDPVGAFIQSAKNVLAERVQNSPPERNEERWLKGWNNRINSY